MDELTLFGALAVTSMLVFYALEEREAVLVPCFCRAARVYGFHAGRLVHRCR